MLHDITPETTELIKQEEECLRIVLESLDSQSRQNSKRMGLSSQTARALTAQIVSAERDIDKQMLASDEAVAHQLSRKSHLAATELEKLRRRPYFARIVLAEEQKGSPAREIEYKLGFAANSDCRIVDWRRAPIAKLYYEYQEGEEYSEIIQGRERSGIVKMRVQVEIEDSTLVGISCRQGELRKENNRWVCRSGAALKDMNARDALPDVLSLITADQFRLITSDPDTAVLIQGIAGSGKTTVALHRLTWLLHEENSPLAPNQCLVLVFTKALRSYVTQTLAHLGAGAVPVLTFRSWVDKILPSLLNVKTVIRPEEAQTGGVSRVKRSLAMLLALEEAQLTGLIDQSAPYTEAILDVLSRPERLLKHDETGLLDRALIQEACVQTKSLFARGLIDYADDALIIRLHQLRTGAMAMPDGSQGLFEHIVVDEAQEFNSPEIAAVIGALRQPSHLTLVGDTAQQIRQDALFPGWARIRERFANTDGQTRLTTLSVSHRSSLPIMRLADFIYGEKRTSEGKKGKPPIWFKCLTENEGIRQILAWLERVIRRYPNSVIAVVCPNTAEARYALSLLKPTFGAAARLGDEDSFSFGAGILVSSVEQIKGLEFPNVLIWNPSSKAYPANDTARNMLYVAVTRAEDRLCLVTWGKPSTLLPHITSSLVRGHQPDSPE